MELTFISDTHNLHRSLILPGGDILFHCGDITQDGTLEEIEDFSNFISKSNYQHKIVIAGNHDFCFENKDRDKAEAILADNGINYLNDSFTIVEGLKIWGSPVQPWFFDWAFNRQRGDEIKRHWDLIPSDTDILLTHGPPYGILDQITNGKHKGCEELLKKVENLSLKIHAFGHIHESHGELDSGSQLYINASQCDLSGKLSNLPINIVI